MSRVLHYTTFPEVELKDRVSKLKKGGPLLIYIYYRFDNRPKWFKFIWSITDIARKVISRITFFAKLFISKIIVLFIYLPLAKLSKYLSYRGLELEKILLYDYREKSFYENRCI